MREDLNDDAALISHADNIINSAKHSAGLVTQLIECVGKRNNK